MATPDLSLTVESLGDFAQYKLSDEFPPTRESEWTIPAGKDGWSLSHNALRGEMEFLDKAVTKLSQEEKLEEEWKVTSLLAMWKHHRNHVVCHHTAEDVVLQPALEKRFKYPEKAGEGHKDLENLLHDVDKALSSWQQSSKTNVDATNVLSQYQIYDKAMREHLHAEEVLGVPLMRAFFSQAEFKPIGRELGKQGGPPGSFVYFIGEDEFRDGFMTRHNMPFFLWYMVFGPALKEFKNDFLRHAIALTETNREPPPPEDVSPYSCAIL